MKTNLIYVFSIIFCSFVLLSRQANAQSLTGEISGKVLDEQHKAFPFASVSLLNAKDSTSVRGTLTSDNGLYELKGLNAGKYLVAINVIGYKKQLKVHF